MKKDDAVKKIGDMLGDRHIHISDTKKVKIMQRSVYHKYAEVEVEVPIHIEETFDVHEWLMENEDLWSQDMEDAIDNAAIEGGNGVDDYDGMNEPESDCEWRYQIPGGDGGHL